MRNISFVLTLIGLLVLLAACQPQVEIVEKEVTRPVEETVEVTRVVDVAAPTLTPEVVEVEVTRVVKPSPVAQIPVGSPDRPVRLLFPHTIPAGVVTARGEILTQALAEATGMRFVVEQPAGYEALIGEMCAAPAETIGFMPALGYVLAHDLCEVQVGNAGLRQGLPWMAGMVVARADSGIRTVADLDGRTWAVPAPDSLTRSLAFQAMFAEAGVVVSETVAMNGDNSALLAVYEGEVDFATATFTPPLMPEGEQWTYGEDGAEVWRRLGLAPERHPIGYVIVLADPEDGGYRIRDARAALFDTTPGIFNETRIITITEHIPNDTVAFGSQFPLGLARPVIATLTDFGATEQCSQSICSGDFYGWDGLAPVTDNFYDPLRFIIDTLSLTDEDVLAALNAQP